MFKLLKNIPKTGIITRNYSSQSSRDEIVYFGCCGNLRSFRCKCDDGSGHNYKKHLELTKRHFDKGGLVADPTKKKRMGTSDWDDPHIYTKTPGTNLYVQTSSGYQKIKEPLYVFPEHTMPYACFSEPF